MKQVPKLDNFNIVVTKMTESNSNILYCGKVYRTDLENDIFSGFDITCWQIKSFIENGMTKEEAIEECLSRVWMDISLYARFIGHHQSEIKVDSLTKEEQQYIQNQNHLNYCCKKCHK